MATQPLIVIVGPTASGKTELAINIAKRIGGEIICADSRTAYKGMDIGTAKPTQEEQEEVKHWGLDLVYPNQRFTVADFQDYAKHKVRDIRGRGLAPIIVGGTGLYVDAVVFDYKLGPRSNERLRQKLEKMTIDELQKYCYENNINLPENSKNKRYVIRAIEQKSVNKKRKSRPIKNCYIVGITTDKDILLERINERATKIFDQGVVAESRELADKYGWNHESMTGNIYPLCRLYLDGDISLEQAKEKFKTLDWRLAKRQITWLKRNEHINWRTLDKAEQYILSLFESEQ